MKNISYILIVLFASVFFSNCDKASQTANTNQTTGKAGSLARFAMVNNYLYAINNQKLMVFDATDPTNITLKNSMIVGETIETIFPFRDKLFIASNSGMYMYSISNPIQPVKESFVQHLTGCDPVVANETNAYLTIHSGRRCGFTTVNELQVYKLGNNIANPTYEMSIPMTNPIGLGLKDNYLFVCDKGKGLVVFDITNADKPIQKELITGENFIDVIVYDNILLCMLEDGIAYYDISDMDNIQKLSVLS